MRKIIVIFTGFMCLFLSIMHAQDIAYSTTNNNGCVLSVAMCKKQYYLLEPIKFKILIRNIDKGDVIFEERFFQNFSIEILDKNKNKVVNLTKQGTLMHSGLFMGSGKYEHIFIKSNTIKEFTIFLNLLFDLSRPGDYNIIIHFKYVRRIQGKSTQEKVSLRFPIKIIVPNSNEVDFTLVQSQINCLSFVKKKKLYQHLNQDFLQKIDMQVIEDWQTNYPCFDALKEIGLPFSSFTNELNKAESGTEKEKLLHDLGQNLYGDIFPLYLKQLEKNK
jgi:hypothetical protein